MSVAARPRPEARNHTAIALGLFAVVVIAALAAWLYASTRPKTTAVARRDIVLLLPLSGQVVAPPGARADIASPYRAPVAKVYASVGDRVKLGDSLVELSHPTAQVAYDQARQELQAAQADYEAARRQHSVAVDTADSELAKARATERQAREAASSGATFSPAEGEVAVREPAADLANATAARIAAEQALLQAQADRDAALTPYRQRVDAAQAAFREAQSGRKMMLIRAPIAGTVLALNAQPGREVGVDRKTPVVTIVDLGELQVHARMDNDQAASVQVGTPAVLAFEQLPGKEFEAEVTRITTAPDRPLGGDERVAILEFKNDEGLVKPDMRASVSIRLGRAHNALAVPSNAIDHDRNSRPVIEVLRAGRWQKVVVEPGLSDGRYTAIRSGLNEGETVKVTPDLL